MQPMPFSADVRKDGGAAVIDLHGEINATANQALNEAYDRAIGMNGSTVILNFEDTTYINSTGIALIVGLLARSRVEERKITACGLTDHYKEIFQITRIADFMAIFDDEQQAISATG
jgi:anti-anti-sigma factor